MATSVTSTNDVSVAINIVARRGDTFKRWVRFRKNGIEETLSASQYSMQVKQGLVLKLEFGSTINGTLTIGETPGVIILYQTAEVMQVLLPGTYQYDFQQKKADGTVITLFAGSFTVTDDITRILS